MSSRSMLVFAAISGLVFFALGALGAHVLGGTIGPNEMAWVRTALEYQGFHTLTILALAVVMQSRVSLWFYWCGALLHLKICVYITPVGGVCFLIGWVLMLIGALRLRTEAGCHE
ncbi:DUF423 domain-containing protein [Serratia symbiotica]|uniref:Putative UPF0382 inner membrane protein YgdD n=1 Tax=Serratia symbiotica SCt-VLC TaxID=1347341 RepID=A0A068RBA0_9GAMM|nr:DUF423 domain-containing protein [Serratia symbiotica]CDG48257.1 Putative UPF0382 inner membrane protein YgdD [Serratia symbiotica SCt-VLC]